MYPVDFFACGRTMCADYAVEYLHKVKALQVYVTLPSPRDTMYLRMDREEKNLRIGRLSVGGPPSMMSWDVPLPCFRLPPSPLSYQIIQVPPLSLCLSLSLSAYWCISLSLSVSWLSWKNILPSWFILTSWIHKGVVWPLQDRCGVWWDCLLRRYVTSVTVWEVDLLLSFPT